MNRSGLFGLIFFCFSIFVQLASAAVNDGLIASYSFSGNADDESGNGYNGTVVGATLCLDRFGNPDSAYHFDGVNDYIDIGVFDGVKSVSMWFRQGLREEFEFYFGHNTFRLYASTLSNGRLMFGDGSPYKLYTNVSMDDYMDQWVHVVVIGDGVKSKIYLNGVNVTESSGNIGPALSSVVNLGRWPGPFPSARHYMKGDIDDVRIYNRVLSEDDVFDLYWGVPSAPDMFAEPLCTVGKSNEVAWTMQDGPVEYWVEATAVMHYAPSSRPGNRSLPLGWDMQNHSEKKLEMWSRHSGWISATSYQFTDLRLNTIYLYRVKAAVVTEDGRLEGEWSDWTPSCQVPVLPISLR